MAATGGTTPVGGARALIIDTNILIAIEDHSTTGHTNGLVAARFASFAAKNGLSLVVADGTRNDFLRATPAVRKVRFRQLDRYHVLGRITPTRDQRSRFGVPAGSKANDECDLEILSALDNNAAEILVSEDKLLRRRGASGGLADRVISLSEAVAYLEALGGEPVRLPNLERIHAYQIPAGVSILDSLRADYPGFDAWWQRVQAERREVLIAGDTNEPEALCVLKVEPSPPSNIAGTTHSLKLCTFKVADSSPGKRLGELMLKAAIDDARSRGLESIFITVMPDKTDMLEFLDRFGFIPVIGASTDLPGEIVLEKRLSPVGPPRNALDHAIAYGPGAVNSTRAHIVPIKPGYVVELLPETQANIGLGVDVPTRACGNAIRKAYLSNTPSRRVQPGDLLCFYMSQSERAIIATGVAEETLASRDPVELLAFVGTRTVYTPQEVQTLAARGEVLAVLFRFDRVVSEPATIFELRSMGVLSAAPQSFVGVPEDKVDVLCQRLLT